MYNELMYECIQCTNIQCTNVRMYTSTHCSCILQYHTGSLISGAATGREGAATGREGAV